jgi:hypothetical protein
MTEREGALRRKEETRRIRLPLAITLQHLAECGDCAATITIDWRFGSIRQFEVGARILPCFEHAIELTEAMAAAEQVIAGG